MDDCYSRVSKFSQKTYLLNISLYLANLAASRKRARLALCKTTVGSESFHSFIGACRNKKPFFNSCIDMSSAETNSSADKTAFLDSGQYSANSLARYQKIFGDTFVSEGGLESTKVRNRVFFLFLKVCLLRTRTASCCRVGQTGTHSINKVKPRWSRFVLV
jgi:hypothetical protein